MSEEQLDTLLYELGRNCYALKTSEQRSAAFGALRAVCDALVIDSDAHAVVVAVSGTGNEARVSTFALNANRYMALSMLANVLEYSTEEMEGAPADATLN